MSAFSELVNIQFKDATSYPATVSGDVLSLPFWHFWGPRESLIPLNRTEFLQAYQVSFPPAKTVFEKSKLERYYSALNNFVQIKRAFEAGATSALGLRLVSPGSTIYDKRWAIKRNSNTLEQVFLDTETSENVVVYFKHFGIPTCKDLGLDESKLWTLLVEFEVSDKVASLILFAKGDEGVNRIIEKIEGSIDPLDSGNALNPYIGDVLQNSQYFSQFNSVKLDELGDFVLEFEIQTVDAGSSPYNWDEYEWLANGSSYPKLTESYKAVATGGVTIVNIQSQIVSTGTIPSIYCTFPAPPTIDMPSDKYRIEGTGVYLHIDYFVNRETVINASYGSQKATITVYNKDGKITVEPFYPLDSADTYRTDLIEKLLDPQVSNYSIFIVPSYETSVKELFYSLASDRKDTVVLWGYPVSNAYDEESILSYKNSLMAAVTAPKFFNLFMHGREEYVCFTYPYKFDGTALWAGRMVNVARDVRLNQLPSAQRYGLVNAQIKQTLTFNQVLRLHEQGVNSLYLSTQGPMIFGIKALFERQTSYWAKANVSRVTAAIIKATIPEVMNVIHTDVVSDPIERSKFQVVLNRILDERIAAGDIKPESYADVSDAINTDKVTKGGEILNVILTIFFKKLAEKVNITIIATDSSVDVNIS